MQVAEKLVFEDDYQPKKSRKPSLKEEIEVFAEEIEIAFEGNWHRAIVAIPVGLIVAWALVTLWFLTPIFE